MIGAALATLDIVCGNGIGERERVAAGSNVRAPACEAASGLEGGLKQAAAILVEQGSLLAASQACVNLAADGVVAPDVGGEGWARRSAYPEKYWCVDVYLLEKMCSPSHLLKRFAPYIVNHPCVRTVDQRVVKLTVNCVVHRPGVMGSLGTLREKRDLAHL